MTYFCRLSLNTESTVI